MEKNKIRIRKKIITPDTIDRYKNYSGIVKRHDRYLRMKGLIRFLIYFTIGVIFLVIIIFAMWKVRDEEYKKSQQKKPAALIEKFQDSKISKL
jgi:hypothetical protein